MRVRTRTPCRTHATNSGAVQTPCSLDLLLRARMREYAELRVVALARHARRRSARLAATAALRRRAPTASDTAQAARQAPAPAEPSGMRAGGAGVAEEAATESPPGRPAA